MIGRGVRAAMAAVAGIGCLTASGQVLYDGSLGTFPAAQGWTFASLPVTPPQTMSEGAVRLDTTASTSIQSGYSRLAPGGLDRSAGFTLGFAVRLERETHNNTNRAGFSVVVLAADKRGIELAFWTNRVFAQSDNPLFVHAEEAAVDNASAVVDYALTIAGDRYRLRSGGRALLEGPVRDYTGFTGLIDPYETPDFIFLGDDTSSAAGAFALTSVVLIRPPVLTMRADGRVTWPGLAGVEYTVEASADLVTWQTVGTARAVDGVCQFDAANLSQPAFIRVVGP